MTDTELRDAAVSALAMTTISYPEWKRRVVANKYPDVRKTQWWQAFDYLERIGEQPEPAPAWPPVDTTPPAWTPTRHVTVQSQLGFLNEYAAARDGDRIQVINTTFTQQINLSRKFTGAGIEIGFSPEVVFRGDPTRDLNAVFVTGTKHRIFGGTLSNQAGHGILFHASSDVLWHGFNVAGVGGSCLRVFAVGGNVERLDLVGEVSHCGGDLTLDPHAEKGTGLHPSYIGGGADPAFNVRLSRFVIDAHDCATGSNQIGPFAVENSLYYRARRLTKVATQQVAGNAVQMFGGNVSDNSIWVEADTVARVVETGALQQGTFVNEVWHGRGTNVRLQPAYMPHPAVTYQDCA